MDLRRYGVAVEESRRGLDQQAADLESIRQRTTNLVVVGGLAATFLGGLAVRDEADVSAWTIAGAVSFAGVLVIVVATLWPREFEFTQRTNVLVGWAEQADVTMDGMERDLALYLSEQYGRNAKKLLWLVWLHTAGLILLVFEVAFLLIDLRGR